MILVTGGRLSILKRLHSRWVITLILIMPGSNLPEINYLSEQAILLDWGTGINLELNRRIHRIAKQIQQNPFLGFKEVLPAYSSLAIFFDPITIEKENPGKIPFNVVKDRIVQVLQKFPEDEIQFKGQLIEIPVLYNGPDLEQLAEIKKLTVSEIIQIHCSRNYDVFMLGFLPGFAYLGLLDEKIATPRKSTPRTHVPSGSVGIAGSQTGIYPVDSPGGWQLIGTTPLKMFDPLRPQPALLQAGDQVRFHPITASKFDKLKKDS